MNSISFKHFPWADVSFDEFEREDGPTRYYITPDGKFPSMTSMLSILDDGGIDAWKKAVGEEEANKIVTEAANRGNALHDYNELYLKNQLKRSDLKGQARTLFNRIKRYLDCIQLVVGTEEHLYSKLYGFAGTADAIVMLDDEITMVDHKNSRRPIDLNKDYGRKKLFKYMLQCVGYAIALEEMKGMKVTQGCIIVGNHLTSNADQFKFKIDEYWYKQFKILVDAYNNKIDIKESDYFKL